MKPSRKNFKKLIGRAVEIEWEEDIDADWYFFRVENVHKDHVTMSGTADDDNNPHDGTFIVAYFTEIKGLYLRW